MLDCFIFIKVGVTLRRFLPAASGLGEVERQVEEVRGGVRRKREEEMRIKEKKS